MWHGLHESFHTFNIFLFYFPFRNEKCGNVDEPIDSEMFHNPSCDTILKNLDEATQTGIAENNVSVRLYLHRQTISLEYA